MRWRDILAYALGNLRFNPLRTAMMTLAMAIGVAAVLTLTALGDGARRYVIGEFSALGTHLLFVLPGHSETRGLNLAAGLTESVRPLTLADAEALRRSPLVRAVAPVVVGSAYADAGGVGRDVVVLGSTTELLSVREWRMRQGRFLPAGDWRQTRPVCVLGSTVARDLFGTGPAVGRWLRLGDRRFRVAGVLATEGRTLGFDNGELVVIPVASAQRLFDREGLFRILIQARSAAALPAAEAWVRETLIRRHRGHEDFTILTQGALLASFDRILRALTLGVAAIAAISLGVAGILIMNLLLIGIARRIPEIGLLKALGASQRSILVLFLAEAVLLALLGALAGLLVGVLGNRLLDLLLPVLAPLRPPRWSLLAAPVLAVTTGAVFGLWPARRAARLHPVEALERR